VAEDGRGSGAFLDLDAGDWGRIVAIAREVQPAAQF